MKGLGYFSKQLLSITAESILTMKPTLTLHSIPTINTPSTFTGLHAAEGTPFVYPGVFREMDIGPIPGEVVGIIGLTALASAGTVLARRARRFLASPPVIRKTSRVHFDGAEIGSVIDGRYQVIKKIGEGWFSSVYEVTDNQDGEKYALKHGHPRSVNHTDWDTIAPGFKRELELGRELNHPHIVNPFDGKVDPINMYTVMELQDATTIEEYLLNVNPTGPEIITLILQILDALEYCHAKGISIGDIKVDNILINNESSGTAKALLCDLQTANRVDQDGYIKMRRIEGRYEYKNNTWKDFDKPFNGVFNDVYGIGVVLKRLEQAARHILFPEQLIPIIKSITQWYEHDIYPKTISELKSALEPFLDPNLWGHPGDQYPNLPPEVQKLILKK